MADITAVDITEGAWTSANLTILGVPLGATRPEAEAAVRRAGDYTIATDAPNPTRFYVHDRNGGKTVAYFIWEPGDPKLARVAVFEPFADRLVGETKSLVTRDALRSDTTVGKRLGAPDSSTVTLDIPSIALKLTEHRYRSRGLLVTEEQIEAGKPSRVASFTLMRLDLAQLPPVRAKTL